MFMWCLFCMGAYYPDFMVVWVQLLQLLQIDCYGTETGYILFIPPPDLQHSLLSLRELVISFVCRNTSLPVKHNSRPCGLKDVPLVNV